MTLEREPPLDGEVVGDDDVWPDDDLGGRDDVGTGPEPPLRDELIRNAPALTRLAAGLWWQAARWGAGATARTSGRLVRAAGDPVRAAQAVDDLGRELRQYARDLLGITELDHRVAQLLGAAEDGDTRNGIEDDATGEPVDAGAPERAGLRALGAQLLRASAQLEPDDTAHPAYAHILAELAPDEARILRLLATDGARPAIDVRGANLIGVSSELVSGGLNMIGAEAGCLHRDRVPAYLNNLERLGLIWFSREPIDDPVAYQVLEAQPEVLEAMHATSRAKAVQRSILLTPFGHDFCEVCFPPPTDAIGRPPAVGLDPLRGGAASSARP